MDAFFITTADRWPFWDPNPQLTVHNPYVLTTNHQTQSELREEFSAFKLNSPDTELYRVLPRVRNFKFI